MRSMIEHVAGIETARAARLQAQTLVHAARYLMLARGNAFKAEKLAENARAFEPIKAMIKAAVDPGSTGGWGSQLAGVDTSVSAFLGSLVSWGAFDGSVDDMTRVPIRTRVAVSTLAPTSASVAEGSAKIVSKLTLSSVSISELKVAVMIVASDELLKNAPAAARLIGDEMRKGVARETDKQFITEITSGLSPITSGGATADKVAADLAAAVAALTISADAKLYTFTTPAIAKAIRTKPQGTTGEFAFPGPISGGAFGPTTLIASDGVPSATMVVADVSQLAADPGIVQLDGTNQATIEMNDAPTSPPVASNVYVNLWQNNLSGLRCERIFAVERPRATSVAVVNTISY